MSLPWNIIIAVDKDRLPLISAAAEAFLPTSPPVTTTQRGRPSYQQDHGLQHFS
jgi:hypothetical protein